MPGIAIAIDIDMNLTKCKVIAWNGERGIAEDFLGNSIRFTHASIVPTDIAAIRSGIDVLATIRDNSIIIELPTSSFNRWEDERHNCFTINTVDTE